MNDSRANEPEAWLEEDQSGVLRVRYRLERKLFSSRSRFQQVEIVESSGFGRMLVNDGIVMLSERDERVYHEMIAHVPLFVIPRAERVLVVGGGDGGAVREVLRHPGVRHCTLVEIDERVLEACRRHLPVTAAALDDPRVEVRIDDGVAHVARTDERYDLVIVDSSDPIGPAVPLFGSEFYDNVRRVLTERGMVVAQAESPFYEAPAQEALLRILGESFARVGLYNYSNLTYPGGLWSFAIASVEDRCPVGDLDERRIEHADLRFEYYSADVHRAAFALPAFQRDRLRPLLSPLRG